MIARIVSVALLCLGMFCLAQAQVPVTGAGKGAPGGGGGGSYVGPGDLVPGALAWSGLRAYSAAKRGNNVANICNPTDATGADCADWQSDATTGDLVATTINGADCTMVTCSVKLLYDQTGNTNCTSGGAVPCDFGPNSGTAADRPRLAFGSTNCTGTTSKWCMTYDGMTQHLVSTSAGTASTITISQPLTQSFIFYHTNNGRNDISPNFGVNFGSAANEAYGFFGNFTPITPGAGFDGAWHAVHIVANGASGDIHIDSTTNTNDLGATGLSSTSLFCGRNTNVFAGKLAECGSWGSAVSSGDMDAMAANAKTYWGWP